MLLKNKTKILTNDLAPSNILGICLTSYHWLVVGKICKPLCKAPVLAWLGSPEIVRANLVCLKNPILQAAYSDAPKDSRRQRVSLQLAVTETFHSEEGKRFQRLCTAFSSTHFINRTLPKPFLGRNSSFLETSLQHWYPSLPKDLAEKSGISQHRIRSGKNRCHCMDSSIQSPFQNSS